MTKAKFAAKAGAGRAAWGVSTGSGQQPADRLCPPACRTFFPPHPACTDTAWASSSPSLQCRARGWLCVPVLCAGVHLECATDDPRSPPNTSIFHKGKRQRLSQQGLSEGQHVLPWAVREAKSEFGGRNSAAASQPAVTRAESESSSHCRNPPGLRGGHRRGDTCPGMSLVWDERVLAWGCRGVRKGARSKVLLCPGSLP